MKTIRPLATILIGLLLLFAAPRFVCADETHTGPFFAAGGHLLLLEANGTWNGRPFDPTAAMTSDPAAAVGLNWSEKLLVGGKPAIGYRFSERFALQTGYGYLIPKRSAQIHTQQDGTASYEQRLDWEWRQVAIDLVGIYYPSDEWNFYFFGGLEFARIEIDVAPSESVTQQGASGEFDTISEFTLFSDEIEAWGAVFGGGVEIPSSTLNVATVLSMQYSTARANQTLFGTPDFETGIGGFSLFGGLKWYFASE